MIDQSNPNAISADPQAMELVSSPAPRSPSKRAWLLFKQTRRGYWSLLILSALFALSLIAEVICNDKPLVVKYNGHWYFPVVSNPAETVYGGDFDAPTDYFDPFIRQQLSQDGNFAVFPINPYHYTTLNYFAPDPNPAPPSIENWLGTDDRGRDLVARLLYGFRDSILFA
jgi:microcin C transport system permease protein